MRLEGIHIEDFADGEQGNCKFDRLDGDSLLLVGGNRTGKTLSFNAILYNLLGARETIGLSTGRGNSVELRFTDGSRFHRGSSGATYTDGANEYTGDSAKNKISGKLNDEQIVKNHFVHSHIGKLPLDNLSNSDLISLVRTVTNKEVEQQIQRYDRAVDQLDEMVVEAQDEERRLLEDVSDLERQISEVESQLERHQNLLERIEAGDIEGIRDHLLEDEELERRLEELFNRKEGIRQRLRKLHRQKRKQENYAEEVYTVIAEAVNDFVCPACDRRISTEKAERRLRQRVCPYCGRDHSLSEMRDRIEEKIDKSDDLIEELEEEIEELNEERDEIEEEIEAIQDEQPELVNLDGFVKRKLKDHDYDINSLRQESEDEVEKLHETLEELVEKRDEREEERNQVSDQLEI